MTDSAVHTERTAAAPKRVALIGNDNFAMYHFRSGIISALVKRGYEPVVFVPEGEYTGKMEALGARVEIISISRFMSPLADLRFMMDLQRRLRRLRPAIVHTMTVKPNIFGTLAARAANVPMIVGLVAGAGYLFTPSEGLKDYVSKALARSLYGFALRFSTRVWYLNKDDLEEFVSRGLLARHKGVVIVGEGVDIEKFAPGSVSNTDILALRQELGIPDGNKCIVLIAARMIWSKGIGEFIAAAKAHEKSYPDWTYVLLAPYDSGTYDAVDPGAYEVNRPSNLVVVDEFRKDVAVFTALADIAVLPSYYREGVPRSLMESMVMAKPLIAANSIGTREVVFEGVNGVLVPPRDANAFAEAAAMLMSDAALRTKMGTASHRIALEHFDERVIVKRVLHELYDLDPVHD